MTRAMVVAVVLGVAMLGWVCEGRAATITLDAVADTMLLSTAQPYNHGYLERLEVQNKWQTKVGLIRFDLPGDFVGGTVNSAALRLDVYSTYFTAGTVDVYRSLLPWVEGATSQVWNSPANYTIYDYSLSWNTPGALGAGSDYDNSEVASASFIKGYTGWLSIDVTGLVDDWAAGTTNHGFELQGGSFEMCLYFYTKEAEVAGNGNAPELVLDYDPIPEPATMLLIGTGVLGLLGWARRRRMR